MFDRDVSIPQERVGDLLGVTREGSGLFGHVWVGLGFIRLVLINWPGWIWEFTVLGV